jgi:hypothetical protein
MMTLLTIPTLTITMLTVTILTTTTLTMTMCEVILDAGYLALSRPDREPHLVDLISMLELLIYNL